MSVPGQCFSSYEGESFTEPGCPLVLLLPLVPRSQHRRCPSQFVTGPVMISGCVNKSSLVGSGSEVAVTQGCQIAHPSLWNGY